MSLTASLEVESAPDSVTFRFAVTNDGNNPADVQFRSAKHADVVVTEDDEVVWRWSEGQMFAQMLQPISIEPDQTETYEFEWPDPEPGSYEAVATLNATESVSATESFAVSS